MLRQTIIKKSPLKTLSLMSNIDCNNMITQPQYRIFCINFKRIVFVCSCQIKNNIYQKYPNVTPALQDGLPIGSGEIESAHKSLIQRRVKIPGAWWQLDNADYMIALRAMIA